MKYFFIILTLTISLFTQNLKAIAPNDTVKIPDPAFKTFLLDYKYEDGNFTRNLDRNQDGEIQESEALLLKKLTALGSTTTISSIKSIQGIEYFKNLTAIEIPNTLQLESVDLTRNENLTLLYLGGKFSDIDLRNNTKLRTLEINNFNLENILFYQDNIIRNVTLNSNTMETFTFPELKNISTLNLFLMNSLKELDIKIYPELKNLSLRSKSIKSLDFNDLKQLNSLFLDELTIDLKSFSLVDFKYLTRFGLGDISTIEQIDLKDNNSTSFDYIYLDNLPNLKRVCVDDESEKNAFIKALEPKDQWENLNYLVGENCNDILSNTNINSLKSIKISPNPVKTSFIIKDIDVKFLELINYSGQIVRTWKAQSNYSIEGLPKGSYILIIHNLDSKKSFKLLIE
ncbi:T9SS type A sorting domain-containing protein [Empedobacter falsenii]